MSQIWPDKIQLRNTSGLIINPATEESLSILSQTGWYLFSDLDEVSPITYIGYENKDGWWIIKKLDETIGMIMTYATGESNYNANWVNRASLTYGSPSIIF